MPSHSRQREASRLVVPLLALLLASGCSSWKHLQPITPGAYAAAAVTSEMRVVLTDGRSMSIYFPRMDGDTLRGLRTSQPVVWSKLIAPDPPRPDSCCVALRDLTAVEMKRTDLAKTAMLIGIPLILFFGTAAGLAAND